MFRRLARAEAKALAREKFADIVEAPVSDPVQLRPGERVLGYLSQYAAKVRDPDGDVGLMQSMLPMRSDVGDGTMAPVDMSLRAGETTFRPANPLVKTVIPRDLDEGISFSELGYSIRLTGSSSTDPLEAVEDRVLATNIVADTDALIAPTPTGIETTLFVRSEDAPEASALQFGFERGQRLRETDGPLGRSIEIVAADGTPQGVVQAPSGRDADGEPVEVTIELEGEDKVVVRYPHRDRDLSMPLAIDPVVDNYQIDPGDAGQAGERGDGPVLLLG